jgi:hypothetical protein
MMRTSTLVFGLAFVVARAASGQVIQETQTTQAPNGAITQTTTTTGPAGLVGGPRRMSQLIGSNVQLQGANNFGRVEDVLLDQNGGIGYLVVGNGGRHALMPWNAANFNHANRVVSYNVTPQAVQPLFFTPGAWPNMSDQQFTSRMAGVFPNAGVVNRRALRPVAGAVPGEPVIEEKVKPNGTVKVRERP